MKEREEKLRKILEPKRERQFVLATKIYIFSCLLKRINREAERETVYLAPKIHTFHKSGTQNKGEMRRDKIPKNYKVVQY